MSAPLAMLTAMVAQPLARTNAVKNILGAVANTVAAVAFAVLGHVDWAAVVPLAAGFIIGGWTGPALVRSGDGTLMAAWTTKGGDGSDRSGSGLEIVDLQPKELTRAGPVWLPTPSNIVASPCAKVFSGSLVRRPA